MEPQRRGSPRLPAQAGSAEGNYRPVAGDVFIDPADVRYEAAFIPGDQAMRIERAVLGLGMPYTRLVVLVFVRLLPLSVAARQLGIVNARQRFDDALQRIGEALSGLPDQRRRDDRVRAVLR
ncbi:MAG: hypothetical protein IPO75_14385 [Betaproteobacteria bacterium]|nr:hypothetical protein [Betaproteobacteria bacterium]